MATLFETAKATIDILMALSPTQFFVATDGDDADPGTEAEPLLTLGAAQTAVRAEIAANGMGDGIEVNLRGGTYERTTSLALTSLDSGESGNPVVWRSYPGEDALITGSQTLDPAWAHKYQHRVP